VIIDTGKSRATLHKHVQVSLDGSPNRISLDVFSSRLSDLPWQEVKSFKGVVTRSSCWLVDKDCSCTYKYGYKSWAPTTFPTWIKQMALSLEAFYGRPADSFNACNCNRYASANEDLTWHSDNEPMFRGSDSTKPKERDVFILSVSFGSSREFAFRPKYGSKTSTVLLEDGDVVTMEGNLQDSHEHIVRQGQGPQASSIRYNLTFRTILRHNRRCSKFS
jgi:alkylated DNA repair dioxygenase AlkB